MIIAGSFCRSCKLETVSYSISLIHKSISQKNIFNHSYYICPIRMFILNEIISRNYKVSIYKSKAKYSYFCIAANHSSICAYEYINCVEFVLNVKLQTFMTGNKLQAS